MSQGGTRGQNLGTFKVILCFSDLCRYFSDHLLENIYIWAIGAIYDRLPLDILRHSGTFPRVGIEVKLWGIFSFLESSVFEQQVLSFFDSRP